MSKFKWLFSKELAKGVISNSSLRQRTGLFSLYTGAALATGIGVTRFEQERRNYYGEDRYNSYYGAGADTTRATIALLGITAGGMSLINRDPISRLKNSYRYRAAQFQSTKWSDLWEHPFTRPRKKAGRLNKAYIADLKHKPRFGPFSISLYSSLLGVSPAGYIADHPLAQQILGGIALATTAAVIGWAGKKVMPAGRAGLLAIPSGGYAGYQVGSSISYPMAEGNIISFREHNQEGVRKMDFNTAGLTLALHKNNRKV